ncbi:UDP-N-acetyl glucosamine 2-epimerase [Massilia varians]|uniref:UDP-N-acetyl glucosamine 2-epimerase n=1 Tax=Massilia varians TaxID=457921 RepID=A0ABN6THY8_9BURK|nr:UDP-N-acetylglucosamine 2-epimerase (non-hydrolyzing) [Massilia varians]BDT60630.1 UDP-N-acetyl glucosamine 2-epimerase [Massilia varians]
MAVKLKVMTLVGTRPEIIRLSRVIAKLDEHCEHVLVHTGQNYDYELNEVFFRDLGIRKPDLFLEAAGATAAQTIAQVIQASDQAMGTHNPEAVLVLGDTNSCLATISAKRRKIPIFHMEAGNRCFDFRVPEEINRRIVDHTSDINLTYSDIARDYLLREGLPPDQVIKTGSPMREVIEYYLPGIQASDAVERLQLADGAYTVVSTHREENVDCPESLKRLFGVLNAVAERHQEPVIVSTHPRTRKRLDALGMEAHPLVQFHKPFGFFDYISLQTRARAVLSDSGTITEESSILNFPALNLREVHERPEGFEEAAVMMVGLSVERVLQGLDILATQPRGTKRLLRLVNDYSQGNVSEKMLRIIQSYTDFVNRKVWRKI